MGSSVSRSRAAALACLVAGLLPLVVAPSLSGCVGCTDIGCASPATRTLDLPADVTLPAGSTITACFNDFCASSTLSEAVLPGAFGGLGFPFRSGDDVYLSGYIDQGRLEVDYAVQDPRKLRAGDRYRLTVVAPSGEIIAENEATAVGYDKYDLGPDACGGACQRARFL